VRKSRQKEQHACGLHKVGHDTASLDEKGRTRATYVTSFLFQEQKQCCRTRRMPDRKHTLITQVVNKSKGRGLQCLLYLAPNNQGN